jgi:DNA primase
LPLVPREKIDDVRERTNIVEVIKRHVELKRAGTANFVGLCPFHSEKTPSFNVHEARQFFHCFGCGEKGDVFTFVTKIEQRPFAEVLRDLARDAGVDLPEKAMSPAERQALLEAESEKGLMLRAVEAAVAFFEQQLQTPAGAAARAYISGRGISDDVAKRFRLGYAPAAWDALQKHLAGLKIPPAIAERLGLVGVNERGRYDFFRDRVMLPVLDRAKRPTGFSSRLLDPEAKDRKYVNSPDSPLFHKKEQLYGLHAALDGIRKERRAIVVEGNFDVLALHEAGITEAVAPMGTALTAEQVGMLGRTADRVVMVFDGDSAGERAGQKAVALFVDADVDGRISRLPAGQDPDDFVRRAAPDGGPEAFRKLVEAGRPVVEQFIDDLARGTEATIPDRMKALEDAATVLGRVHNPTARELYVGRLASTLGLSSGQVWRAVRSAAADHGARRPQPTAATDAAPAPAEKREPPREELEAVVLIIAKPELMGGAETQDQTRENVRRVSELLTDPGLQLACRIALQDQEETKAGSKLDVGGWLEKTPADIRDAIARALMDGRFDRVPDAARALADFVKRLEAGRRERMLEQYKIALAEAIRQRDEVAIRELSARQMELIRTKHGVQVPAEAVKTR